MKPTLYTARDAFQNSHEFQIPVNFPENGLESLTDLLDDCLRYDKVHIIPISEQHFDHLVKEFDFYSPRPDTDRCFSLFYINGAEGMLHAIHIPEREINPYLLVIWVDPKEHNANYEFHQRLKKSLVLLDLVGLKHLLDIKNKGLITDESLAIASEIIYG